MEQPSNASLRSSGIPRFSRLPVPRGPEKSIPTHDPIKYTPKRNNPSIQAQKNTIVPTLAKAETGSTARASSTDVKPIDDFDTGTKAKDEVLEAAPLRAHTLPRRPRPSLSDRTIETLAQIPPSPSPARRKSGFFPSESPSRPSSRPRSSLSRSRPSTSHGHRPPLPTGPSSRPASPTKRSLLPTTGNHTLKTTPSRRSVSSFVPKSVPHSSTRPYSVKEPSPSKARPSESASFSHAKESADSVGNYPTVESVRGSKTLFARPSKPRPSAQDVFPETLGKPFGSKREATSNKARARSPGSSANSSEPVSKFPPPSKMSSRTSTDSGDPLSTSKLSNAPKVPSSSATLRETIAKAKAARQKVNKIQGTGPVGNRQQAEASPDFDFDDTASILRKRVASARTDGRLNIAALGLNKMPSEVTNMYNANPGDGSWYESVDLVRLIAADNEFEHLDDGSFPDEDPESDEAEDEYQGNMFGGLETLDLHGNHLKALPMGLRRLERLTTLNVSKNKLNNESISKIARIRSLRELRLADNALNGTLDAELCDLKSLEVLDLHNNMISNLPSNLHELSNLRTINIAGNRLSLLPFDCFSALPLVELDVARNRLSGTLFPPGMQGFPGLKTLDVANNALTAFTQNAVVCLPSLQALNVIENRLTALPDISSWTELITLTAGGNQISSFPEGLTALTRVKTLDFSRNDIRKLDEQIGLMESLAVLRIANNPLRERRFLNMDTDEIKHELKLRLLPEETADTMVCESRDASDMAPNGSMESSRVWPVKPGGMLDRSSTRLETVESTDLEPFVGTNNVKTFVLNRNQLSRIPSSLELLGHSLVKIDMSHNKLNAATYLPDEISLPNLRSLDLSSNAISTLSPIVDNLFAPRMTELDMSRNRLTSLLPLRSKFVSLISLSAADNSISVLEVGVAQGLRVMDISGNELTHLEPKLGLLDADGLRTLLVGGNRFRVPRREVIDKGTEAVLTWLKSRIPDEELHES